jgi:hypothetical protein
MFDDDHENLFSSFGAAPTTAAKPPASAPRSPTVPPVRAEASSNGDAGRTSPAASLPGSGLPLASSLPASMVPECILSVQWRNISAADRHAIEAQLRSLRVPTPSLPPPNRTASEGEVVEPAAERGEIKRPAGGTASIPVACGAAPAPAGPLVVHEFGCVHYCQAYCIDWQGEASASDAAGLPTPQYSVLLSTPLPLPPRLPACSPSACFNCGKEGHQSRSCPMPKAAVPLFSAPTKTGPRKAPTFKGRYFDPEPMSGSMAPGLLSAELQDMLGMRPLDPPPYLSRMQRVGFPPAYVGKASPTSAGEGTPVGNPTPASPAGVTGANGEPEAASSRIDAAGVKIDAVGAETASAALETAPASEMNPADLFLKMYREAPGAPSGVAAAPGAGMDVEKGLSLPTVGAAGEGPGGKGPGGNAQAVAAPMVQLPGLNAPPPQGADWRRWGWRPEQPVTKIARIWR